MSEYKKSYQDETDNRYVSKVKPFKYGEKVIISLKGKKVVGHVREWSENQYLVVVACGGRPGTEKEVVVASRSIIRLETRY